MRTKEKNFIEILGSQWFEPIKVKHFSRLGDPKTLKTLEDLGFLSDEPIVKMGSPLDSVDILYCHLHPSSFHRCISSSFPSPPPSLMNQLWRCEARSVINSSSLSFVQCPLLLFSSFKSSENQNKTFAEQDPFKLLIPRSDEHPPLWPAQLCQGREGYDPHEAWGSYHLNQDNQWENRKINVRLFVQF